ncbi:hypothetical protein M409DRAFT_57108 [Zasmidium cellare ATCC 36951]|uniref:Uncharacterized protein n=1 Tax=Zasmidium cellare ATCC 36951 TaxID=1080233 RepID=A0A6A6CED2_ZASCE|nr:uncharacterized protein M409DRAFT_57108 [Zasmidium cellare ATCC 36951]KAF2164009.1 hypothetical protein M409DRAFT_57108 [Zasmidium cellare ATCC 36951]
MYWQSLFGFAPLFLVWTLAQQPSCATVSGGCDQGSTNNAAIQVAINRFDTSKSYGGQSIIFSTFLDGETLAQISYTCEDVSNNTPIIDGSEAQALLSQILQCNNQCGSTAVSSDSSCGFGVLVDSNAGTEDCFSKAINITPESTSTKTPPPPPPSTTSPPTTSTTSTKTTITSVPASVVSADASDVQSKVSAAMAQAAAFQNNPSQDGLSDTQSAVQDALNSAQKAQSDVGGDPSDWGGFLDQISNVISGLESAETGLTGAAASAAVAAAAAAAISGAATAAAAAVAAAAAESSNQNPTTTPPIGTTQSPSASMSSSSSQTCNLCVSCADSTLPSVDDPPQETDAPDSSSAPASVSGALSRRTMKKIQRRDTSVKIITVCSKTFTSRPYSPPSSGNFPFYGYRIDASTSRCSRNPKIFFNAAVNPTPSDSFDTEHVFEAQIVTQFLNSLASLAAGGKISNNGDCGANGLLMRYFLRTAAFPGIAGQANTPFKKKGGIMSAAAADELMYNLSADNDPNEPDSDNELVFLEERLNSLKQAVFNSKTGQFSSFATATDQLAAVTRLGVLANYLTDNTVAAIFTKVSRRMFATMQKFDQTIQSSTIAKPVDSDGDPISFATLYSVFQTNFLFSIDGPPRTSMSTQITSATNQISSDSRLGSPGLRMMFVAQINEITAAGQLMFPDKWLDVSSTLEVDF